MTRRRAQKHHRELLARLAAEGFEVVEAWNGGRHLRLRVRRAGREATLTSSGSPAVPEHDVDNTLKAARRATRPA